MAFLLYVPFLLLRFGLMGLLGGRQALARAQQFPPFEKGERWAYGVYQLANAGVLLYPLFLRVQVTPAARFWIGAAVYLLGLGLLAASVAGFCAPGGSGFSQGGVYRLSRNPMYVAYFLVFLGCALLAGSGVLLGLVLVFQVAAHWLIRAEERWCLGQFGDAYRRYIGRVRRYF